MKYIKCFDEIRITDIAQVGGKNASLGEMISQLGTKGIRIPQGFAITAQGYWHYLECNQLVDRMKTAISQLTDVSDLKMLSHVGATIRTAIEQGSIPDDLKQEMITAYRNLSHYYKTDACDVAMRSSATAEDLPTASFAGQQDTFLNVAGDKDLLLFYKKGLASLFTDRAIAYRIDKGFDHFKVALSVGVQKMIRSDKAVSGVAFSLDTETGFKDVVTIEASYGLGETIVQGLVTPDEFIVHKPTLLKGFKSIIKKQCGDKKIKLVYSDAKKELTKTVVVGGDEQHLFCLQDSEILELAHFVVTIEQYYSHLKGSWSPMDIEWAKDGIDGLLYIVQARPETVSQGKNVSILRMYSLQLAPTSEPIVTGLSIGQKIVSGIAKRMNSPRDNAQVKPGTIIVTDMTDPDWVPLMKSAAGIITNKGGRTCHAAIVSRELGIPAVVGTHNGTECIKDGDEITIDCSRGMNGYVYKGQIPFKVNELSLSDIPTHKVNVMINCADPSSAFQNSFLPVTGVGLARIEFIITSAIKIHPMALVHPEKIDNDEIKKKIADITSAYLDGKEFFVQTLAHGIGIIAAAFYPRPVIVRFSDFKTNEYRNLIGGSFFEPVEENPMLGFRGASRYYDPQYQHAFALECEAIKTVRNVMGLTNVKVMVPFVRTVYEASRVIAEMAKNGLTQQQNGLEVIMMCEIPSNVILIEEFSTFFDGFSIGSNDLTQLVLGVDRDSGLLSTLFDERDEAVKKMMAMAIEGAHKRGKYIGICGQAPSDYPDVADFLIAHAIDSLSLNADAVISFLMR